MKEKLGKFIVPFDERHKVLEIQNISHREFSGINWYECKYLNSDSSRSFNTTREMETFAIFDSLIEANKVANMTVGQLIVEYVQGNRAIERLCRKNVELKGFDPTESPSVAEAVELGQIKE